MLKAMPDGQVLAPAGPVRYTRPRRAELADVISSIWVTAAPSDDAAVRVLPDAAIDLVLSGRRLAVAGPDTKPCLESLAPGVVIGMQIRPTAVPALLGVPASAVRDDRVDIADLWGSAGRVLVERLASAPDIAGAVALLERACVAQLSGASPAPAPGDLRRLLRDGHALDPHDLGVSERQLRRRCLARFGYGPRMLARIVRFQSVLEQLRAYPDAPLADLAIRTGHVDQSHLAREIGAFSGLTPAALRRLHAPVHRAA